MKTRFLVGFVSGGAAVLAARSVSRRAVADSTIEPHAERDQARVEQELADQRNLVTRNAIKRQVFIVAVCAVTTVAVIVLQGVAPDSGPLTSFDVTGGLDLELAVASVSALLGLVAALTIALVASPRIDKLPAVDRMAAASWSQAAASVTAVAAGIAAGLAFTQWISTAADATGWVLVFLAGLAVVISCRAVPRLSDLVESGLLAHEEQRMQRVVSAASTAAPGFERTRARFVPYFVGPVVFGGYYCVNLATSRQARIKINFVEDAAVALVVLVLVGFYQVAPWRVATYEFLKHRLRRGNSVGARLSRSTFWLLALLPALTVLLLVFTATESLSARAALTGAMLLTAVPTSAGVMCSALALSNRGPWKHLSSLVAKSLRAELEMVASRRTQYERVAR